MVPVLVVEIVPARVVEIVPLLAVAAPQIASVRKAANEREVIFFIGVSPGYEHQGLGRLKEVALGSLRLWADHLKELGYALVNSMCVPRRHLA